MRRFRLNQLVRHNLGSAILKITDTPNCRTKVAGEWVYVVECRPLKKDLSINKKLRPFTFPETSIQPLF